MGGGVRQRGEGGKGEGAASAHVLIPSPFFPVHSLDPSSEHIVIPGNETVNTTVSQFYQPSFVFFVFGKSYDTPP